MIYACILDENNKVILAQGFDYKLAEIASMYGVLEDNIIVVDSFNDLPSVSDDVDVFYNNGAFEYVTKVQDMPHKPTNAEVAQMISDLQADLIIAGVI